MIGDYLAVASVLAIATSFVFIIRCFWLRDVFKEEAPASVPAKKECKCRVSTPKTSPERNREEHYGTL